MTNGAKHHLSLDVHATDPNITTEQICRRIGEALDGFTYEHDGFVPEHPFPMALIYPEIQQ